jgi:HNH endonuclease
VKKYKRHIANYQPKNKTKWTASMILFLQQNWQEMTNQQLADNLDLRLTTTRTKLYELGFYRMELEYWTKAQITFLKKNYQKKGDVELAEIFNKKWNKKKGWSKKHIEKKRRYLKLKRTAKQMRQIKERNKQQGRFSINHWKRWIARVAQEGDVRQWDIKGRPVMVIKEGNSFKHLNRVVYQKHFGKIPDRMAVVFKDGNPLNCSPENLMLDTKARVMTRNSIARFPKDVRLAIHAVHQLKRKIKTYEKQD